MYTHSLYPIFLVIQSSQPIAYESLVPPHHKVMIPDSPDQPSNLKSMVCVGGSIVHLADLADLALPLDAGYASAQGRGTRAVRSEARCCPCFFEPKNVYRNHPKSGDFLGRTPWLGWVVEDSGVPHLDDIPQHSTAPTTAPKKFQT